MRPSRGDRIRRCGTCTPPNEEQRKRKRRGAAVVRGCDDTTAAALTAFQVLSEYLQMLDSVSELSVVQEMSRGVEVWLGKTLQKLDALLLQVCQEFKEEKYITVSISPCSA
ncbi:hypothetical protein Ancab_007696 [Ancistrocladus abbreviatus]